MMEERDNNVTGNPLAAIKYARFKISGFPVKYRNGKEVIKHAVLIPDTMMTNKDMVNYVLKLLNITSPSLLLEGVGGSFHPQCVLQPAEMASPDLRKLVPREKTVGKSAKVVNNLIRSEVHTKLQMIVKSLLLSLEEQGAYTVHFSSWCTIFDMLFSGVVQNGEAGQNLEGISTMHLNDWTICDHLSMDMIDDMFKNSVPLREDTMKTANIIEWDGQWLADGIARDKPWEGHSCTDGKDRYDPVDLKPASQWCNLHSDHYWFWYTPDQNGNWNRERNPDLFGFDPFLERHIIAPPACIFMDGRSNSVLDSYRQCFQNATPAVAVLHSGGLTNVYGHMLTLVADLIQGNTDEMSEVIVDGREVADFEGLDPAGRLSLVDARKLLSYAYRRSYQDPDQPVKVQVRHVIKMLDHAKAKPLVFTNTVRVVNPLTMTDEACLEILSSALSSEYTGPDLQNTTSGDDVINEAWRVFLCLDERARIFGRYFVSLDVTRVILIWFSFVSGVFAAQGERCLPLTVAGIRRPENLISSVCSLALEQPESFRFMVALMRRVIVVLPILVILLQGVLFAIRYQTKWATAVMACEDIKSQIYRFRCSAAPYTKGKTISDRGLSEREADSLIVSLFSRKLENIYQFAMSQGLKHDAVAMPARNLRQKRSNILEMGDDGVSKLSAERYFAFRLCPLKQQYEALKPRVKLQYRAATITVLLCCASSAYLMLFSCATFVPILLGIAMCLQHVMVVTDWGGQTSATSIAVDSLRSTVSMWNKLKPADQRNPQIRGDLVITVEQTHMSVVQAKTAAIYDQDDQM